MQAIRAVDGHGTMQSPGPGEPAGKKKRVYKDKDKATNSKSKPHSEKPVKSTKDSKPTKDSTDQKFDDLDQKWSDQFNRLEALLLAKILAKEPTFQTIKVAPSHSPPPGVGKSTQPFYQADQPCYNTSLSRFAWHRLLCYHASVCQQTSNRPI